MATTADLGYRLQTASRNLLTKTGLGGAARWVWTRRPSNRAYRRWSAWLTEADRLDNERIRLVLASVLHEDSNCIDIGASGGVFLREMIRLSPKGHHIAYEPLPEDCRLLAEEYPGVDIRNAATSNMRGTSEFTFVRNSPGWSGFRNYDVPVPHADIESISVATIALDDDLPPGYVPSFIKIDVNGAEKQVLEGAVETLKLHRPVVLFEHGQAAATYGTTPEMIFDLLVTGCGLRIFDLEGNGPFDAASFAEATRSKWNFLARP